MSYTIFRCEGVKSLSDLTNRGKHNKRDRINKLYRRKGLRLFLKS